MAQGVAVVEDRPQAPLALVGRHHLGLGSGGALQQGLQQLRSDDPDRIDGPGRLQQGEQPGVADHPVLDHLGHAGAELPLGQGGQGCGVDQHQPRLVEGADQVLAARVVHARLAADRRIHHRQQGGGHLHHGDAPQPGGRRKPRHVAHHAAAEGHDQRTPLQLALKGGVVDLGHGGRCFLVFPGLDHQGTGSQIGGLQAGQGRRAVVLLHHRVGHQQHLGARLEAPLPDQCPHPAEAAGADHHRVGIGAEGHLDRAAGGQRGGGHGPWAVG